MPHRLLSRLSIRLTAPALLAAPVLLVSVVLITIGAVQGRAAVERLASQQLAQIHDRIGEHVRSLVEMPGRVNRANLALLESGRFDPAAPREWGPVLIEQFRAFGTLSAITWGGEDGRCTWVARYAGDDEHLYYAIKDDQTGENIVEYRVNAEGVIETEPRGAFPLDPRTRPWYLAPKRAGAPAWSEPFLWVGGADEQAPTLGVAFGSPWFGDDGELIGVIDADLSLQDISRYLANLSIGRTGRAYLYDSEGFLLASSTGAPVATAGGERVLARESDAGWILASARRIDAADAGARDFEAVTRIDDEPQWLRASPFVHDSGLDWTIVTVVPESDFMAEIAAGQRRSAWFTAGAALGALGLGLLIASLLVRPFVTLSQHVRRIGEGDLESDIELAYARELATLADDINRMTADLRDRMALRKSLALAMDVQQSLLPSDTPAVRGLDIAGHSTYCDETGGDYYDYLEIADISNSTAALVVGDVMGHGIAAAMLMATARGILRSRCTESGSLGALLGHLNDLLVEVTGGARFMTMVLLTIDGAQGTLRLASAGHDPPFIYDPTTDDFIELDEGGLPLGIMAGEEYAEATCESLPVGAVVMASTDGVWEAQNEHEEQFGKERIHEIIRANAHRSAREIGDAIRDAVQAFCANARQLDDITFVVVRRVAVDDA
ncbi:MAG: SpoIIE family protein phosphatase [Phycisphaerales bacterium]